MNKDAYYFPHFCNARNDRKLRRLRKELGVEGYGIYFMLLEVLREQKDFRYPMEDLDLLSDEFRTSDQKVHVVINNYDLFEIDENEQFFSPRFIEYLTPYLEQKQRNRINGVRGNLIRHNHATKAQLSKMSDDEILRLNDELRDLSGGESGGESRGESGCGRNKSKGKERKVNKNTPSVSPQRNEVPMIELSIKDFDKGTSNREEKIDLLTYTIFQIVSKNIPKTHKHIREATVNKWRDHVRLMNEQDDLTFKEIYKIAKFAGQDDFWRGTISSTGGLRKNHPEIQKKMLRPKPASETMPSYSTKEFEVI